jgi:FkbM family methyltransferase
MAVNCLLGNESNRREPTMAHTSEYPGGSQGPAGALGVREFAGVRFRYRIGSVDERVLDDQYHGPRFFSGGYQPKDTDTILDAGAHIGVFTALAARQAPRGAVYALEPARENFDILRANVVTNGLDHVFAHRVALSDTTGSIRLYHGPQSWGHTLMVPPPTTKATFEEVPSQTLEDFIAEHGIQMIDYLKMNIEGAEYKIFLGAPAHVLHRIGFMMVELHPAEDALVEELLAWIRSAGFTTDVVWSDDPTVKGWLTAARQR